MPAKAPASNSVLRNLPSVDELLRSNIAQIMVADCGEKHTAVLAREAIDAVRREMSGSAGDDLSKASVIAVVEANFEKAWRAEQTAGTHRVINATGVVIHTNLGRAPLSEAARQAITDEAAGYCTLEYDLETGRRGRRGKHAEDLVAELTGAESVLIVNNCAAAAFFVLTAFAAGGEVIISRGELVEIGGDFRVPDVLAQSGAKLSEVGTTNRTKLADYERAITKDTRMILRVHPSNYRIIGFTATPSIADLADLAHKHDLIIYEDLGSGALIDLEGLGLRDEPVVRDSIEAGADIVTFSGDKLLGGPQAGIIAGKAEFIDHLRKNPLYRALRVDKLAYAALEATLEPYRRAAAADEIPVLSMLSLSKDSIVERLIKFTGELRDRLGENSHLRIDTVDGVSAIGGGAAPAIQLETKLLALAHKKISVPDLEQMLRASSPPIITRVVDNKIMIDLRTVSETEEADLIRVLINL